MGHVIDLIQSNYWSQLAAWLATLKRQERDRDGSLLAELCVPDRFGRTPLHYACAKKRAPDHVVSAMLDKVADKWTALTCRDSYGNTLLHAAAACGNANVVRVLLENIFSPPSFGGQSCSYYSGSSALEQASSCCDEHSGSGVGLTPLWMAWKKYLDPSFTLFGDVSPSAGRMSPQILQNIQLALKLKSAADLQSEEYNILCDLWNKTVLLLFAAYNGSMDHALFGGRIWRPLHSIATVGGRNDVQCPTVAMWLAVKLYQEHLSHRDEHGNLPLHLAALYDELPVLQISDRHHTVRMRRENCSGDYTSVPIDEDDCLESISKTPILVSLSRKFARAASTTNINKRLPLHLAIESGKKWNRGIHALLEACPESLERRDGETGLYPFLLAAASPKSSLDVVYELIQYRPDLIGHAVNSQQESSPQQSKPVLFGSSIQPLDSRPSTFESQPPDCFRSVHVIEGA